MVSPEFAVKEGTGGGAIDFYIASKKWGFELLRDRNRVVQHMERFEDGGQYFSMIQSRSMEQYIVLDFTVMQPRKTRPGITALLLPDQVPTNILVGISGPPLSCSVPRKLPKC